MKIGSGHISLDEIFSRENIDEYISDVEYAANKYILRCFFVTMITYTVAFLLNVFGVFIIDKKIMMTGYIASVVIYGIVYLVSRKINLKSPAAKYFIMTAMVVTFTIIGISITYHVTLISFLPFLCATIYSRKSFKWYVYALTVISTIFVVYGGYYWGLCDANMVLLTTKSLPEYISESGNFLLSKVNENPAVTLFLFFVVPRCLTYIAFMAICSSIFSILSGSVERARLSEELRIAKNDAERANSEKSKFLARMSHEIRTPINAVMGMNEMILRETTEDNIRQYAQDVKDSSSLLLDILNDILDTSKIEAGKMEIVPHPYKTARLIDDIYNMTNIKAREKGLELIFDVATNLPAELYGDDKLIRQILLNLLSNAVKYTRTGSVTLKVFLKELVGDEATIHFSVIDTGIGIKPEDIEKLRHEYQRVDAEKNRNIEGTGLGMSIVTKLLSLFRSELEIKSEYEKGSEFSFDLAQQVTDSSDMGNFMNATVDTEPDERINYVAPGARILVVDDYSMNLKVFSGLLKHTQIQIKEALSGEECIALAKKQRYDIIFLDHMMPGMDGIEAFRILKEEKLCEGTPVVMLTANASNYDKESYDNEGFDDLVLKPIMPAALDKVILKYLPKHLVTYVEAPPAPETASSPAPAAPTVSDILENTADVDIIEKINTAIPEINTDKGLATCSGDKDFYLELFEDFTKLDIKSELTNYLKNSDNLNYCIRVHGFKNTAYSIGAVRLGDLAYNMEVLTREEMPDNIDELQDSLFEQYDRICQRFESIKK